MNSKHIAYLCFILTYGLIHGCGSGKAPITDHSSGGGRAILPNPGTYEVKRGDTLSAISWQYGLNYHDVARWNNINERFLIYPGQVLRLTPPPTGAEGVSLVGSTNQQVTHQAVSRQQPAPVAVSPIKWRWPAEGPIISRFSSQEGGSKGIAISGSDGASVVAAADGRVVYAGSGLLGYGNLVIINHGHDYLSAYAHNSRILVSENDSVKAGDKVAEMGQTGADRVQLHFEIRRNGKPIDPLSYLPRE